MRHEYLSVYNLKNHTITSDRISVGEISVGGGGALTKTMSFTAHKGSFNVFNVSGAVRIKMAQRCTANLNGKSSATINIGVPGALTRFLGATTASFIDSGEFWFSPTGTANVATMPVSRMIDQLVINKNVKLGVNNTSLTAGTLVFHCWWEPIESGAKVTAA